MQLRTGILFATFIFLAIFGILPAMAVQGIPADLYYVAPDANGAAQIFRIDEANTIEQISAGDGVTDFEITPDGQVVYTTTTSLNIGETSITTGGPLDSAAINLQGVAVSPGAAQMAVIAVVPEGNADPAEGVWLYDLNSSTWTLLLNSIRNTPATVYIGVEWALSGDRLILDADFGDGTTGVIAHNLNTEQSLPFNEDGTGNIQSGGYGRAALSLDGTAMILSDVPNSPNGNGFIVDVNNSQRVIPLGDDSLGPRYLSHAIPIADGTAFFIRDFGNDIASSEVWQLSTEGARVALGSIPDRDLGFSADWTADGNALAYIQLADPADTRGTLQVFQRVEENMEPVSLPENITDVSAVQWGPLPSTREAGLPEAVITAPTFDFLNEEQVAHYSVRLQWPADIGSSPYQMTVQPGFDGQESFEVENNAARINRMPCDTVYTITIGNSRPYTVSTPRCDVGLFPVTADPLYPRTGGAPAQAQPAEDDPPPAQPAEEQPADEASPPPAEPADEASPPPAEPADEQPADEQPADEASPPPAEPADEQPAGEAEILPPGTDQGGPATVTDLSAGTPAPEGALTDGRSTFAVDLSWSVPEQQVPFYLVAVSPPFGENQRDRVPVRAQQGEPSVSTTVSGLVCGETYTFVVQSIADDGITVLTNSEPTTATTPACE